MSDQPAEPRICSTHKGALIPRPLSRQTYEQRWCGTWFDCPHGDTTVLIPSPELRVELERQQARIDAEGSAAPAAPTSRLRTRRTT